jgi:hypothetical protein
MDKDLLKKQIKDQEVMQQTLKQAQYQIKETQQILVNMYHKERQLLEEIAYYSQGTTAQQHAYRQVQDAELQQQQRTRTCEEALQSQQYAEKNAGEKQDMLQHDLKKLEVDHAKN